MLSADLAGRLSGRAVEIRVRPLVFREYLEFRRAYCPGEDESGMLNDFIRWDLQYRLCEGHHREEQDQEPSGTLEHISVHDEDDRETAVGKGSLRIPGRQGLQDGSVSGRVVRRIPGGFASVREGRGRRLMSQSRRGSAANSTYAIWASEGPRSRSRRKMSSA